jgi:hypothetical protein
MESRFREVTPRELFSSLSAIRSLFRFNALNLLCARSGIAFVSTLVLVKRLPQGLGRLSPRERSVADGGKCLVWGPMGTFKLFISDICCKRVNSRYSGLRRSATWTLAVGCSFQGSVQILPGLDGWRSVETGETGSSPPSILGV